MPREAGKREDPAQQDAPPSIVNQGLHIIGDLKSAGHIHIDGTIQGDLQVASVVVGKKGSIEGKVVADNIDVYGFVSGNITARVVEFRATAHVLGDTTYEELYVEKGACFVVNFRNSSQD